MAKGICNFFHEEFIMRVLFFHPEKYLNIGIPSGISLLSAILKQHGFETDLFDTTFLKVAPSDNQQHKMSLDRGDANISAGDEPSTVPAATHHYQHPSTSTPKETNKTKHAFTIHIRRRSKNVKRWYGSCISSKNCFVWTSHFSVKFARLALC